MSTPHKASAKQWKAPLHGHHAESILELRARVEALEAGATCPHIITSDEGSSYCTLAEQVAAMESAAPPASSLVERPVTFDEDENDRRFEHAKAIIDKPAPAPASSLVERVADAIVTKATSAGIVDDRPARAAIREVAAWLRDRYQWAWVAQMAQTLEQEAGR